VQQVELVLRRLGAQAHGLARETVGRPRLQRLRAEAAALRDEACVQSARTSLLVVIARCTSAMRRSAVRER
jgi:hypothetical protein